MSDTNTVDVARAALAAFDAAGPATVLQTVPTLAYALRALIPEPPTDDEREALATQYTHEHGDSQTRADFLAGFDAGHRHRGPITDDSTSHAGTEYALEVGFDEETEGVYLAESFEEMATPGELLPYVPGTRLVERQWSVTDWVPVPADEIDDEADAEAAR